MNEHEIMSKIEELVEQIPYQKATVSIITEEKTITLEKTKVEKKTQMGFSKE